MAVSGENLPFVISAGTILCDIVVNLLCNQVSNSMQQSNFIVTRTLPYLVWFTVTAFWVVFKRWTRRVYILRQHEPFILFVGTVLLDVLINLLCNDVSSEVQQHTFVSQRSLPYAVLFATAVLWFLIRMVENLQSQTQQASTPKGIFQLNDSVWELHPPIDGIPQMDILLFHGFQLPSDDSTDTFWKTWLARDTEQVVWPKEWLGKTYPNARIMAISYHHSLATKSHGELHDMGTLERSLVKDIVLAKHLNIGQNCPVMLIGHSLGGVVIKEFLLTAVKMKLTAIQPITNRVNTFLDNVRGVFYFAVPHEHSRIEELAQQIPSKNPTLDALKAIAARRLEIQEEFGQLGTELRVRSFAVQEGLNTKRLGFNGIIVGEASPVRYEVDRSYVDTTADHFCVCRPTNTEARTYTILVQFLASAMADGMMRKYAGCGQSGLLVLRP